MSKADISAFLRSKVRDRVLTEWERGPMGHYLDHAYPVLIERLQVDIVDLEIDFLVGGADSSGRPMLTARIGAHPDHGRQAIDVLHPLYDGWASPVAMVHAAEVLQKHAWLSARRMRLTENGISADILPAYCIDVPQILTDIQPHDLDAIVTRASRAKGALAVGSFTEAPRDYRRTWEMATDYMEWTGTQMIVTVDDPERLVVEAMMLSPALALQRHANGTYRITLGQMLPDTVAMAIKGRSIAEIISHPMLSDSTMLVAGVTNAKGRCDLRVKMPTRPRNVEWKNDATDSVNLDSVGEWLKQER